MDDITITINNEVLQQAKGTYQSMRQQVDQEIGRQGYLFGWFDGAMVQARYQMVSAAESVLAEQLWYQLGLEEIASSSREGRNNLEHMRGSAGATAQHMIAANLGPVGHALEPFTESVNVALGRAVNEYWNISDWLYPANTVSLAYSSATDRNFSQLGQLLRYAADAVDAVLRMIDNLLQGESAFIARLLAGGPRETMGAAPSPRETMGAAPGGTQTMGSEVESYLSSRFEVSSEVGLTREGEDKTVGVSVDVSGNLWDKGESTQTKVAGVSIKDSNGIRLGVFGASAGLEASLDPNAEHWGQAGVSAEFTGVELYHEDVVGSDEWGVTDSANVKALSADAFAGFQDGTLGAKVGVDLISAEGGVGVNVAGVKVGVDATIGIKAELGIEVGKRVEVKLPFVSFGFSIGG